MSLTLEPDITRSIGEGTGLTCRELFKVQVGKEPLKEIRESTNRGLALGSDSFSAQIEKLTNARVTKKRIGRPQKK